MVLEPNLVIAAPHTRPADEKVKTLSKDLDSKETQFSSESY